MSEAGIPVSFIFIVIRLFSAEACTNRPKVI